MVKRCSKMLKCYLSIILRLKYRFFCSCYYTRVCFLFSIMTLNIVDTVIRYISDVNYDKQRVASVGLRLRLVGMVLKTLYLVIWDN